MTSFSRLSNFVNRVSRKGFASNFLTKYSDLEKVRPHLYYADPLFLFDYCKRNFSRNVALLNDYDLYDLGVFPMSYKTIKQPKVTGNT